MVNSRNFMHWCCFRSCTVVGQLRNFLDRCCLRTGSIFCQFRNFMHWSCIRTCTIIGSAQELHALVLFQGFNRQLVSSELLEPVRYLVQFHKSSILELPELALLLNRFDCGSSYQHTSETGSVVTWSEITSLLQFLYLQYNCE